MMKHSHINTYISNQFQSFQLLIHLSIFKVIPRAKNRFENDSLIVHMNCTQRKRESQRFSRTLNSFIRQTAIEIQVIAKISLQLNESLARPSICQSASFTIGVCLIVQFTICYIYLALREEKKKRTRQ